MALISMHFMHMAYFLGSLFSLHEHIAYVGLLAQLSNTDQSVSP